MNRIFLFFLLMPLSFGIIKAQVSDQQTYTIYCENISTEQQYKSVQKYLLNTYSEKISHYTFELNSHQATVVCTVSALDILQLYKQLGYDAIYYSSDHKKYQLSPDERSMKLIKEVY